jgi:hypothetical protein
VTGSSMTFAVEHLGLAAWLVTQGYEYRQTGKKTFMFPPEAEAGGEALAPAGRGALEEHEQRDQQALLTKHAADRA